MYAVNPQDRKDVIRQVHKERADRGDEEDEEDDSDESMADGGRRQDPGTRRPVPRVLPQHQVREEGVRAEGEGTRNIKGARTGEAEGPA